MTAGMHEKFPVETLQSRLRRRPRSTAHGRGALRTSVSRPTSRHRRRTAAHSICKSPARFLSRPSRALPLRPRRGDSRCPRRPAPAYRGSASSRTAAADRRSPRERPPLQTASADRWQNGRARWLALCSPTPVTKDVRNCSYHWVTAVHLPLFVKSNPVSQFIENARESSLPSTSRRPPRSTQKRRRRQSRSRRMPQASSATIRAQRPPVAAPTPCRHAGRVFARARQSPHDFRGASGRGASYLLRLGVADL